MKRWITLPPVDFQADLVETPTEVFEFHSGEPVPSALVESAAMVDSSRTESTIRQELESVDFYITQGYADIATDTLDLMERQFGPHPGIDERREKLKPVPRQTVLSRRPQGSMFLFWRAGLSASIN